jgi:CheY-like chemotaxis protein
VHAQTESQTQALKKTHVEQAEQAETTQIVCVIEDDEVTREMFRILLEDAGYCVREAADGLAGYALLRDAPERLVALVDHKLPAMDGCDLLELIAADEHMRVWHAFIFVTASPQRAEQDCGETLDELDTPIVEKPFDIDTVLDAVAAAIARMAAA